VLREGAALGVVADGRWGELEVWVGFAQGSQWKVIAGTSLFSWLLIVRCSYKFYVPFVEQSLRGKRVGATYQVGSSLSLIQCCLLKSFCSA
jgi:hypothetical protein